MTYAQLAEHAVALERSAVVMDMRQRGYGYDGDRMFGPQVADAQALTTARFSGVAEMFSPFLRVPDPESFRLISERVMWTQVRLNVDDIAHKAQAALDAMLDCDPKATSFLLTVVGSILAIGGAVVTVTGATVRLIVLSEASSSAGALPREDNETLPLAGRNAAAIVEETRRALAALTRQIIDTENTIRDAVQYALAAIAEDRSQFVVPRPMLADMTRATARSWDVGFGDPVG